jgi:hypothetical protein
VVTSDSQEVPQATPPAPAINGTSSAGHGDFEISSIKSCVIPMTRNPTIQLAQGARAQIKLFLIKEMFSSPLPSLKPPIVKIM